MEQIILKSNIHEKCLKIKEVEGGLDFYFKNKNHAMRLVDFLQSIFLVKIKQSKQLISHNENSNTYNYKFTFIVELPKVCRDDLVIIPPKLKGILGGCSFLLICKKVRNFSFKFQLFLFPNIN